MKRLGRNAGFILHEAILGLALATAVAVGVTHLLLVVVQQRRLAREATVAEEEVGNLLETVMAQSWNDTTAERLAAVEPSAECRSWLSDVELHSEVTEESPDVRRIALQLQWRPFSGGQAAPVRLTGWKYRDAEAQR